MIGTGNAGRVSSLRYGARRRLPVNRIGLAFIAVTVFGAFACQTDDKAVITKLDDISKRLAVIEAKLGNAPTAGAAARPQQQARPSADPSAVYAVPVGESASIGAKLAKVTIVEAFTFT